MKTIIYVALLFLFFAWDLILITALLPAEGMGDLMWIFYGNWVLLGYLIICFFGLYGSSAFGVIIVQHFIKGLPRSHFYLPFTILLLLSLLVYLFMIEHYLIIIILGIKLIHSAMVVVGYEGARR